MQHSVLKQRICKNKKQTPLGAFFIASMKRGCYILFFFLAIGFLHAQKLVKKSLINPNISFFRIDTNYCFEIEVYTSNTNEIVVEALIDGEYRKDLILKIMEEGSSVIVSTGFQPSFVHPNDKLSAHKVVSIALKINLPELRNVHVYGTSSNVTVTGLFTNLKVVLNDGRCTLNQVAENVNVTTQSGDITLNSTSGEIKAVTKYGKIYRERIPKSNNRFTLSTISGNINLNKID